MSGRHRPQTTEKVYAAIVTLYAEEEIGPTVREIQRKAQLSSTSVVSYHLRILRGQERIRWKPSIARSIRPLREAAA